MTKKTSTVMSLEAGQGLYLSEHIMMKVMDMYIWIVPMISRWMFRYLGR